MHIIVIHINLKSYIDGIHISIYLYLLYLSFASFWVNHQKCHQPPTSNFHKDLHIFPGRSFPTPKLPFGGWRLEVPTGECGLVAQLPPAKTMIPWYPPASPWLLRYISLYLLRHPCKTKLIYEIYGKIHTKKHVGMTLLGCTWIHNDTWNDSHQQAQLSNFCPHQAISPVTLPSEVILHEGKRGQDLWLPSRFYLLCRPLACSFKSISLMKINTMVVSSVQILGPPTKKHLYDILWFQCKPLLSIAISCHHWTYPKDVDGTTTT